MFIPANDSIANYKKNLTEKTSITFSNSKLIGKNLFYMKIGVTLERTKKKACFSILRNRGP